MRAVISDGTASSAIAWFRAVSHVLASWLAASQPVMCRAGARIQDALLHSLTSDRRGPRRSGAHAAGSDSAATARHCTGQLVYADGPSLRMGGMPPAGCGPGGFSLAAGRRMIP